MKKKFIILNLILVFSLFAFANEENTTKNLSYSDSQNILIDGLFATIRKQDELEKKIEVLEKKISILLNEKKEVVLNTPKVQNILSTPKQTSYKTKGSLYVRAHSNYTSPILEILRKGRVVEVQYTENNMAFIPEFNGFASLKYLERVTSKCIN